MKRARPKSKPSPPALHATTPDENAFEEIVGMIELSRHRAAQTVNAILVDLYWSVGKYISCKILADGWGKRTVGDLSGYVQQRQPGIRGFSPQNLWRMRQFYELYRDHQILSPLVRELPWTHHLIIMGQSKSDAEREFYIRMAIREKWGKRELERQIGAGLFERAVLNPPKVAPLVGQLHPEAVARILQGFARRTSGLQTAMT